MISVYLLLDYSQKIHQSSFPRRKELLLLLRFTVGSLLAILCLLTGRAAAVSTRNILFLLGFGLHLVVVVLLRSAASLENHAAHDNIVNITHIL